MDSLSFASLSNQQFQHSQLDLFERIGELYYRLGDLEKALEYYMRCVGKSKAEPNDGILIIIIFVFIIFLNLFLCFLEF
jgi:tetratricopeptide (TPR) repeat protein